MSTEQELLVKAANHLTEVIHEDADLQEIVRQAVIWNLGEQDPPNDGLYWNTYTMLMTKVIALVASDYSEA